MIPIYGTYQDAKNFYHNPTLENLGWTVASGLGDIFFFTGLGAGINDIVALSSQIIPENGGETGDHGNGAIGLIGWRAC